MSAGTCCRRPAVTAERTETLRSAALRMEQQQLGALVVVEEGRPLAVLTDRDVALQVLALGRDPSAPLAESVGDVPIVAVSEDATLAEACAAMRSDGVRRLPVIGHEGRIVGMLTSDDIVRLAAEDLTALADVAAEQSPGRGRAPATGAARGALHYARPVVAVGEQTPVRDVAARMREADVGCVVVLDGGEAPCGLVTDRDLAVRVVGQGLDGETPVSRVMSAPLFSVAADESLREIARRMSADGVRRLPVVEGTRLAGLVSYDDLLAALGAELNDLGRAARGSIARGRAR